MDPPSQVVAGVRTVTTNMNGRDTLPRCRAHSLFRQRGRAFNHSPQTAAHVRIRAVRLSRNCVSESRIIILIVALASDEYYGISPRVRRL